MGGNDAFSVDFLEAGAATFFDLTTGGAYNA
jgi:hypothetical protein